MAIPTEPVGSLPRPMRLQEAIAANRKPKHGSPDVARDVAFAKIANRVEGTRIASEKLGV